ncbi:MAG: hypothetical protein FWC22_00690 [Treponema sp.]|nr:hypothetical protein [Treponema sp.]
MKKIIVLSLILTILSHTLIAQNNGMTMSSELLLQVSSLPEAKLVFTESIIFPFLQGKSPLTEGNNIKLSAAAEISPISLNGAFKAELTPVAFFVFSAGGRLGAGWHLNLFGNDIYGTGFNLIHTGGESKYDGKGFDALLWKTYAGGTFQFDLAAVFPGDWNHVVFQTYHEINIHGNTRAKNGEAWYFEADEGENRNGWNYYGSFVLGYQMPLFLNMAAFMAEMDIYLYNGVSSQSGKPRTDWGDNLIRWRISNILNFQITEQFSVALITQFRSRRNFTAGTENLHYQERKLDKSNPLRLEFYRVAAMVSYKF